MAVNQTRTLTINTTVVLTPITDEVGRPRYRAEAMMVGDIGGGYCRAVVERDMPDEAVACAIGFACDGIRVS